MWPEFAHPWSKVPQCLPFLHPVHFVLIFLPEMWVHTFINSHGVKNQTYWQQGVHFVIHFWYLKEKKKKKSTFGQRYRQIFKKRENNISYLCISFFTCVKCQIQITKLPTIKLWLGLALRGFVSSLFSFSV